MVNNLDIKINRKYSFCVIIRTLVAQNIKSIYLIADFGTSRFGQKDIELHLEAG